VKTLTCWKDLEPFGVIALTGESCGMAYRVLFDVTERGRKALARCLGVPNLRLAYPWNSGATGELHVGSVLLSQEMFTPVAVFALLESGCDEVWLRQDGYLIGFEGQDAPDRRRAWLERHRGQLSRRFGLDGTAGDRNRHEMSGRVE
jgi:hypothetical protein